MQQQMEGSEHQAKEFYEWLKKGDSLIPESAEAKYNGIISGRI